MPMPAGSAILRPEWTALVLLYWCVALPERLGVGWAWLIGCLQDVLQASLLGSHALAFALAAFFMMRLHQRVRTFPLAQQALLVFLLLVLIRLLLLVIDGLVGRPAPGWGYWLPVVTSTLMWPLLFVSLRGMRRFYGVQ